MKYSKTVTIVALFRLQNTSTRCGWLLDISRVDCHPIVATQKDRRHSSFRLVGRIFEDTIIRNNDRYRSLWHRDDEFTCPPKYGTIMNCKCESDFELYLHKRSSYNFDTCYSKTESKDVYTFRSKSNSYKRLITLIYHILLYIVLKRRVYEYLLSPKNAI